MSSACFSTSETLLIIRQGATICQRREVAFTQLTLLPRREDSNGGKMRRVATQTKSSRLDDFCSCKGSNVAEIYLLHLSVSSENSLWDKPQGEIIFLLLIFQITPYEAISFPLYFVSVCVGVCRLVVGCGAELWACVHAPQREQGFAGYWMEGSSVGL